MGNSHSHNHQIPVGQWSQSYPRPKHGQPQVKVLPERVPPLQLRSTDNGTILQNGGTISCRKQSVGQEEKIYRRRSTSAHRPPKLINLEKSRFGSEPDLRFHLRESKEQFTDNAIRQRISRSRKKYKAPPAPQNGMSSGVESSSSDLNGWEGSRKDCAGTPCRKGRLFKTRAETHKKNMTNLRTQDRAESELSRSTEALNSLRSKSQREMCLHSGERPEKKGLKRSASQEVISTRKGLATPEFQAELKEAAQRLRPSGVNRRELVSTGKLVKDEVLTTLKIDIPEGTNVQSNKKVIKVYDSEESGKKEAKKGEERFREGPRDKVERDVPFRKFYFGMKDESGVINVVNSSASTNNVDKTNAEHRLTAVEKSRNLMNLYRSVAEGGPEWEEDTVDRFAANFHKAQKTMANGNTTSCSSSFVSDPDDEVDGGIALQLRPTLPKKQLEIPRFSPTAAWRLLSSIETCSQAPSPGGSDDGPLLLEDRIRAPVQQQALRSGNDKSGDSGISGDASPGGCHESSSEVAAAPAKAVTSQNAKSMIMTWTPQQDLEEESSSDDLESPLSSSKKTICQIAGARFSPRGQLFLSRDQSLAVSVPRDDRMNSIGDSGDFKERNNVEPPPKLNSLRKLKVALGTVKRSDTPEERTHCPNDNWLLSRSVPSSINSHAAITRSVSNPSSPEQDDDCGHQMSSNYPSYSYLANGGRIMYLPEYHSKVSPDVGATRARSCMGNGFLSKSCENISQGEMKQVRRSRSPSPVSAGGRSEGRFQAEGPKATQKRKKFTFQSTVRLLENRRIAERLSREAELKENQRLCEVEAMKKVEEEFQKKRAREKANIRHQLRLFSLEEKNFSSLPPIEWDDHQGDPDCAPSSLPQLLPPHPSRNPLPPNRKSVVDTNKFAPSTQILSEFREPTRDYKDYRLSRYHEPQESANDSNRKYVVEHPKVVYDMPKSTAVYVSAPNASAQNQMKDGNRGGLSPPRSSSSDNYRKDFAHGALPSGGRSLTSSDSELSQSHPRPSSRQEVPFRGFQPMHRSRSASPDSATASASPPPRGSDSSSNSLRSRSSSPKASKSLERKPSSCAENRSKILEDVPGERKTPKRNESFGKGPTDSLLRLGLPSLQPFNRAEKSFRPINFSPVINKLAQIVTYGFIESSMDTSNSILNLMKEASDDSQSSDSVVLKETETNNSTEEKDEIELDPTSENLNGDSLQENNEVILSVYWKRGKLGAAYYSCYDSELHLLNDVIDVHPDFNNLRTLVHQTQPSQVLTCGGLSEDFVKILSEVISMTTGESPPEKEDPAKSIFFMSTRRKEMSYESCKRYILGLRLGFEPESANEEDHILFLNSHIDLGQESMVISLGMLVKYLEKNLPQINLNYDFPQIMFLTHISLNNLVSMDDNTYKALQIFNTRVHPSAFKRNLSGCNREGLSLFGIFNRCRSNAGVRRLREIFTNPSKNIEELNRRLEAVDFCSRPQHQHIVQNMLDCIKRVESVTGTLASIYRARANMSHWRSLYSSLYNAILIGEICQKHSHHSQFLDKVAKSITQNVHEVTHYINQVIDFEESSTKNHFTVRKGVDSKLDLLRRTYAQIPDVLVKVAEIELEDLPSFIEQCSIIYITELGYLLSVPIWKGSGTDASEYTLPDFEVKFIVNNYVHYKTPRCSELDTVLGDSVAAISDIESKIMLTLIQFIHARVADVISAFRLIAELDCVISLAVVASENNYRRPVLSKERKFQIIQGRHPLQELCVDNFVPNDTLFDGDGDGDGGFIKILTGPNASGKSVYLKQVALIAYLAHIGSFVPAQSATIPILDHIHSRVHSVESIATRMSAFLIDLKQMSLALYNSTPRSLIIIDEFGKGTTEIDGLSLLAASLIHLIEREANCPYLVVSTHFHRLPSLLPSTPLVHLQYMDYLIENEEIVYLHKIRSGTSGLSLTHLAAKAAGLSEEAVTRSLQVLNGSAPLECNPKLQVTKVMIKEILYMKKIFELTSENPRPT